MESQSSMSIDGADVRIFECLEAILRGNFDAVAQLALITIGKYVHNILSNPNEAKYRTINLTNKAFVEKVAAATGTSEFLSVIGFSACPSLIGQPPQQIQYLGVDITKLTTAATALDDAFSRLGIPQESRPQTVAQPVSKPSTSSRAPPTPVAFDPFKANVVRTAQQVNFQSQSISPNNIF